MRTLRRYRDPVLSSGYFSAAVMLFSHLLVFCIARLVLLIVYYEDFAGLSFGQTLLGFARGLVFDASITLTLTSLPLFVMILPFDWAASKWCRLVCGWYVFAVLVVFAFVLGGDIVYFREVRRHAGPETWAVGNDLRILLAAALGQLHWIVLVTAALGGVGYAWHRLLRLRVAPVGPPKPRRPDKGVDPTRRKLIVGAVDLLLLILIVIAMRGGLNPLPLNIVDAFEKVPYSVGNLALNGPFSIAHSMRSSYRADMERLPWDEAVSEVRKLLASERDTFLDDGYPLLRERVAPEGDRPNVIVILLESWCNPQIDCLRAASGLPPQGATPEFDALAREGVLFTRFHASGSRSVYAFAAILAGMPTPRSVPYIGLGMEQNRLGYLSRTARDQGYSTYALQGSPRDSYRWAAVCYAAGFENYFGEEDIPLSGHVGGRHHLGAWDYDLYLRAHEVLSAAPRPFLGFIFTLSTHSPCEVPDERWRRPGPDSGLARYLAALSYSDWALGQFIRMAKEGGYYDDTVFVIVADHPSSVCMDPTDRLSYYRIPLLVLAPGLEPGLRDTIGSQSDLVPTIMDLAGWSGRYAALGRSLFDPHLDKPYDGPDERRRGCRFALCVGLVNLWVEERGWILHNLKETVESHATSDGADFEQMARRATAAAQVVITTLQTNTVFRPGEP